MVKQSFTTKVRKLLEKKGPKTPIEIRNKFGNSVSNIGSILWYAKDINFLGSSQSGVYYLTEQEEQAGKKLEELKSEVEKRRRDSQHYFQKYIPRNQDIKNIIDIFTDFETEHSTKEIWEKFGGSYSNIVTDLKDYEEVGVLIGFKKGIEKYYRLNQHSPMHFIADGFFKKAERELDESLKRS